MRRADIMSGVVLFLLGLVMLIMVIPMQIEKAPDGFVSPSLVPNMMMVLITFLAGLLVITSMRNRVRQSEIEESGPVSRAEFAALFKLGAVFAIALSCYLWGSPLAAGVALIAGSLLALGERRPLVIVLMPTVILLGVWLLFYKVLGTAIV